MFIETAALFIYTMNNVSIQFSGIHFFWSAGFDKADFYMTSQAELLKGAAKVQFDFQPPACNRCFTP